MKGKKLKYKLVKSKEKTQKFKRRNGNTIMGKRWKEESMINKLDE